MEEEIKEPLKEYVKLHSKFYKLEDSSLKENSLNEYKRYFEIKKELKKKFLTTNLQNKEIIEIIEYCIENSSKNNNSKKTETIIGKLEKLTNELRDQ